MRSWRHFTASSLQVSSWGAGRPSEEPQVTQPWLLEPSQGARPCPRPAPRLEGKAALEGFQAFTAAQEPRGEAAGEALAQLSVSILASQAFACFPSSRVWQV